MELTWRVPLTAPTVFLLITVVYAAALGGWKGGVASGLVALLYLGWLLTDAGPRTSHRVIRLWPQLGEPAPWSRSTPWRASLATSRTRW